MPSRIRLRPRTTPAIPEADTEVVFLDQADGILKSIDDTGTVTSLGSGAGAGGVTNPVTEPLVVEGQVAETEPSVLIEMTTSEQATETGAALIVRDTEGVSRVAIGDPNESALVSIDPRNSDTGLDGLRVRSASGGIALYTSLGAGDVTIIDRIQIAPDSDGTGAPTFSSRPVDLLATGPPEVSSFRVLYGGGIVTGQAVAPADDDLYAGQVAMWFDSTNGAAKVKFKGKTLDDTVVVGEVALT